MKIKKSVSSGICNQAFYSWDCSEADLIEWWKANSHRATLIQCITPNKAIFMWEQSPKRKEGMRQTYTVNDCNFKRGFGGGEKNFF